MNDMANDAKMDNVIDTLRVRFVASAMEKLDAIDDAIDDIGNGPHDVQATEIKRNAHAIKGMGGSFGFMSVTRIAQAFEEYIDCSEHTGVLTATEARSYNDAMRTILECGDEPGADETDAIIGHLPAPALPAG